jgi:hypothetical protein
MRYFIVAIMFVGCGAKTPSIVKSCPPPSDYQGRFDSVNIGDSVAEVESKMHDGHEQNGNTLIYHRCNQWTFVFDNAILVSKDRR